MTMEPKLPNQSPSGVAAARPDQVRFTLLGEYNIVSGVIAARALFLATAGCAVPPSSQLSLDSARAPCRSARGWRRR